MLSLLKKKKKAKLPARQLGNSCLNCNDKLDGNENFCPSCGQRNNVNQLSFKLFVEEFFGDVFSYDSRLWGTVFPLILKPGKVAYEFVSGRRKKLVNPFRTYLTVSLIFFLVLGMMKTFEQYSGDGTTNENSSFLNFDDDGDDDFTSVQKDSILAAAVSNVQNKVSIDIDSVLATNNINLDSIDTDKMSADSLKNLVKENSPFAKKVTAFYDYHELYKDHAPSQAFDSLGYKNTFWNRFYYDKSISVYNIKNDKTGGIVDKFISGLSIAIFLFLPIFALIFKLIYIRRKYTYMEHMVFVFYTQSVFFLLMLFFLIIYSLSNGKDSLIVIFLLLFAVYIYLAMKKFYKQGWFKTFIKFTLINFSFMIMSGIGFVILGMISFIFY